MPELRDKRSFGISKAATASSAGTYVFPDLLVGNYTVNRRKPASGRPVSKGIQVESNQVRRRVSVLEIGDVSSWWRWRRGGIE